jgi:hypothetical protein
VLVAFGSSAAVKKRFGVTPRMRDRLAVDAELADRVGERIVLNDDALKGPERLRLDHNRKVVHNKRLVVFNWFEELKRRVPKK